MKYSMKTTVDARRLKMRRKKEIKIRTRGRRKYMKTDYTKQSWGEVSEGDLH